MKLSLAGLLLASLLVHSPFISCETSGLSNAQLREGRKYGKRHTHIHKHTDQVLLIVPKETSSNGSPNEVVNGDPGAAATKRSASAPQRWEARTSSSYDPSQDANANSAEVLAAHSASTHTYGHSNSARGAYQPHQTKPSAHTSGATSPAAKPAGVPGRMRPTAAASGAAWKQQQQQQQPQASRTARINSIPSQDTASSGTGSTQQDAEYFYGPGQTFQGAQQGSSGAVDGAAGTSKQQSMQYDVAPVIGVTPEDADAAQMQRHDYKYVRYTPDDDPMYSPGNTYIGGYSRPRKSHRAPPHYTPPPSKSPPSYHQEERYTTEPGPTYEQQGGYIAQPSPPRSYEEPRPRPTPGYPGDGYNGNSGRTGNEYYTTPTPQDGNEYYTGPLPKADGYYTQPNPEPKADDYYPAPTPPVSNDYFRVEQPDPQPKGSDYYAAPSPENGNEYYAATPPKADGYYQQPAPKPKGNDYYAAPNPKDGKDYYTATPPKVDGYYQQPAPQPKGDDYYAAPNPKDGKDYYTATPPKVDGYYQQPAPQPKNNDYYAAPNPKDGKDYYTATPPKTDGYYQQPPPQPKGSDNHAVPAPKADDYYKQPAPAPQGREYYPTPSPNSDKDHYATPPPQSDGYYKQPAEKPQDSKEGYAAPTPKTDDYLADPAPKHKDEETDYKAPAKQGDSKYTEPKRPHYNVKEIEACDPGYGRYGGSSRCTRCPEDHYSPGGEGAACKRCPVESARTYAGSTECNCLPGYGGPDCELCPEGTYSTGGSSAVCTPCGVRLTSPEGSTTVAMCECVAGFGVTPTNPFSCAPCPIGTFNPDPLNPEPRDYSLQIASLDAAGIPPRDLVDAWTNYKPCTQCGKGFSTAHVQSTSRWDCVADCPCGYGTVAPDNDKCVIAPIGSWAPGGPVSSPDTHVRKCPTNRPNTVSEGTCDPKDCLAPPQAYDDNLVFTPNTLTVSPPGLLINDRYDTSCPAREVSVHLLSRPQFGVVTLTPSGGFTYKSTVMPSPSDSFTYKLTDCHGQKSNTTVYLRPEAAPLAVADTFVQSPEGPTIIPGPGILANDTVPCGSAAKVRVVSGPQFGSVLLNSNGGFCYNPTASTLKADLFSYEIECPGGLMSHSVTERGLWEA